MINLDGTSISTYNRPLPTPISFDLKWHISYDFLRSTARRYKFGKAVNIDSILKVGDNEAALGSIKKAIPTDNRSNKMPMRFKLKAGLTSWSAISLKK